MRDFMSDIPIFVEISRRKSFSASAEALGVPVATLSRRIAAMEKNLGIQLLRRTTRKVELTEEGEALYRQCDGIVSEVQNVKETILHGQRRPAGKVRFALPATAYSLYVQEHLGAFSRLWPEIELHVHISTPWVDFNTELFDLEIRFGKQPDSSYKMRKLTTIYGGLYCAPALLQRHALPARPQDLKALPRVHQVGSLNPLRLYTEKKMEVVSLPPPRHVVNNPAVKQELILAGQVFGTMESTVGQKLEAEGRVVRLLPEWRLKGVDVVMVMPPGNPPHRVRIFADYISGLFANNHSPLIPSTR